MSENNEPLELYKQHQASQDRYTYFLLAASGAAIGFAIQQNRWIIAFMVVSSCWRVNCLLGS